MKLTNAEREVIKTLKVDPAKFLAHKKKLASSHEDSLRPVRSIVGDGALTEAEREAIRGTGITPAQYLAYKKKLAEAKARK